MNTLLLDHWKPVPGYEGIYEVSRTGSIRRCGGMALRPSRGNSTGHLKLFLSRNGERESVWVHTVVAKAFLRKPRGKRVEVLHNDGHGWNNRASNLRYGTRSENVKDRHRHGYQAFNGKRCPIAKLQDDEVRAIRAAAGSISMRELGRLFGVTHPQISAIIRRHTYKDVV